MIFDRIPEQQRIWDICVIGSGLVGMPLALECARLGLDVILLESGSAKLNPDMAEASRAVIADSQRHTPMEDAVCRALGGTSWTWGGRCVPFDDVDFEERPYVPDSGWPIHHSDVSKWYAKAAEYLLCGDDTFQSVPSRLRGLDADVSINHLERWSTEPKVILVHRKALAASPRIVACLNSTVIDLDLGEAGRSVENVVVSTATGTAKVKAREVVIAAGGVETTRLLLTVQRHWPSHFGGSAGPLGRFYMGHLSGKISNVIFHDPDAIIDFDYEIGATGTYFRRRFTINSPAQRANQLLNIAFWPDNPVFHHAVHQRGGLSAVFLALAIPALGRHLLPEAIRTIYVGSGPRHYGAHVRNLLLDAPRAANDVLRILHDRYLTRPRKPAFLLRTSSGKYALHYHAEQEPNSQSRITLTDEKDRFGLPRVAVDLRFTERDARSVVKSHRILDSGLRAAGLGCLEYWAPDKDLLNRVLAQASDGVHQAGTTRMGSDPKTSVVDLNLKTHGVVNLHIASGSVFPTTGQANTTFVATALGIRLAHHLRLIANQPSYAVAATAVVRN